MALKCSIFSQENCITRLFARQLQGHPSHLQWPRIENGAEKSTCDIWLLGGLKEVIKGKQLLAQRPAPNLGSENVATFYIMHIVEPCIITAQRVRGKYQRRTGVGKAILERETVLRLLV